MATHPHIHCGIEIGADVPCSFKIYVLLHGAYLMVWAVRTLRSPAEGTGSISGRRAKISKKKNLCTLICAQNIPEGYPRTF